MSPFPLSVESSSVLCWSAREDVKYTSYVTTVAGSNEFRLPFLVTQVSCLSRIAHCVRCAVPKGIFQFQYSMLWKLGEGWSWLAEWLSRRDLDFPGQWVPCLRRTPVYMTRVGVPTPRNVRWWSSSHPRHSRVPLHASSCLTSPAQILSAHAQCVLL